MGQVMAFEHVRAAVNTDDATVLLVGADPDVRHRMADLFDEGGFATLHAADGDVARRMIAETSVDLVVFDERFSTGAYAFCRTSAVRGGAPVMLISEKTDIVSRIVALEVGADEVLQAPIDGRLLIAQARALLRRCGQRAAAGGDETSGWTLDPVTRVAVAPNGRRAELAKHQTALMKIFVDHPGEVMTADRIGEVDPTLRLNPAAFRTSISRLRRRLDALGCGEFIRIVRGSGYVHTPSAT